MLAPFTGVVLEHDPCTEEHALRIGGRRSDDDDAVEPLAQEAYAAVDFAQPLLAVGVFRILGPVALRGGLRHRLCDLRPLDAPQLVEFGAQRYGTGRRYVFRAGSFRGSPTTHCRLLLVARLGARYCRAAAGGFGT